MTRNSTTASTTQPIIETAADLFDNWFDPIEAGLRERVRDFLALMFEGELDEALSRPGYARRGKTAKAAGQEVAGQTGHRHGHRPRSLLGSFGQVTIDMLRARLNTADGKTTEWKSRTLGAYQRRTLAADALIASTYLAGTNTRRVRRALRSLFGGGVSKDTVSRVWRKVKSDWDAWNARALAAEPIVRLILDGTVVRVRLDRKATSISLLIVVGVRADGQKVLLAIKSMGGESAEAWRTVLDDLIERGSRVCRQASGRVRAHAIERLHEEFKRRIKTQTVLPSAETAAMLFWALLASGQISMRKVDGWQTLANQPVGQPLDLAA
jgi:transposase-like protein